jgi:hypothetical protein
VSISSVDFDLPVDFVNEDKRGIERYCASEDGERQRYQGSVAEIKKSWNKGSDLQFGVKVEDGIQENVEGATRADEEASPPPVVVLAAKLEINHDNGDLRASNNENDENKEKESEKVVELVLPQRCENEEKLDKDGAKRQNS